MVLFFTGMSNISDIGKAIVALIPAGSDILYLTAISFLTTPAGISLLEAFSQFPAVQSAFVNSTLGNFLVVDGLPSDRFAIAWVAYGVFLVVSMLTITVQQYQRYKTRAKKGKVAIPNFSFGSWKVKEPIPEDPTEKYPKNVNTPMNMLYIIIDPLVVGIAFTSFAYSLGEPFATAQRNMNLTEWDPRIAGVILIIAHAIAIFFGVEERVEEKKSDSEK